MQNKDAGHRRWVILAILLASLGIAISLYALNHHLQIKIFGRTNAMCNINALFNCDRVAKSQFSEVFGVPLGTLGLSYFLSLISVLVFARSVAIYSLLTMIGVATSFVLAGISAFGVKALCITCISIYTVNFLQALNLWFYRRKKGALFTGVWKMASAGALVVIAGTVLGYMRFEPKLMALMKDPTYYSKVRHFLFRVMAMKPRKVPIFLGRLEAKDIWWGNPKASVTVVEFIDHMCPTCQAFGPYIEKAKEDFGNNILIVYKQYPLAKSCNPHMKQEWHPYACESALVALCLSKQDKYWNYQKRLFEVANNPPFNPWTFIGPVLPFYEMVAHEIGLNNDDIQKCLNDKEAMDQIKRDIELGKRFQIKGTPTVYVNGWPFADFTSYDFLKYEIETQLKITQRLN